MKYFVTIFIVLAVLAAGALFYAWSGVYNIAATEPHWAMTASFIEMLRNRSIKVHSKGILAPDLDEPKLKQTAFPHYHDMCRFCHGAPGYKSDDFSWGLYPVPPKMTSGYIQREFSEAEIYWIVKHGIKMTGMPAFGNTHTERQLWGLVALAEEMPLMSAEQYGKMVKTMNSGEKDHGHDNGESSDHDQTREEHR